jgi:hypothetical protein
LNPTQAPEASPRRTVISAKAEIPRFERYRYVQIWIPAFAGMTHTTNSAAFRVPVSSKGETALMMFQGLKPARHAR